MNCSEFEAGSPPDDWLKSAKAGMGCLFLFYGSHDAVVIPKMHGEYDFCSHMLNKVFGTQKRI